MTTANNRSRVAVYGATGHTAAFVLDELARRGIEAVAVGRRAATPRTPMPVRVAALDDPAALASAFADCAVVINAAGPFLDTAAPVRRVPSVGHQRSSATATSIASMSPPPASALASRSARPP
jgi:short subunit dehydrogenase-like uncharacterized protein